MSSPFVELLGDSLVKGDGSETIGTAAALSGKKTVGLYFSAHVRRRNAQRPARQHLVSVLR
jgi:hypothetical protein